MTLLTRVMAATTISTTLATSAVAQERGGVTPLSRAIRITDINLDWFGLNGSPSNSSESRAPTIKAFLTDHNLLGDVMVFEEIVNLPMLEHDVLGGKYTCHSYQRTDPKHQHVVLCVGAGFTLEPVSASDGYALESVDTSGHLRPAVHGVLKNSAGKALAHIFGVHLKATPASASVRLAQVAKLSDYLASEPTGLPVLLLGDVNSYDDFPQMDSALEKVGLTQIEEDAPFTWASATESFAPAKLDRAWISSSSFADVQEHHVEGPCSSGDKTQIATYNHDVSDHCAVTMTVALPGAE